MALLKTPKDDHDDKTERNTAAVKSEAERREVEESTIAAAKREDAAHRYTEAEADEAMRKHIADGYGAKVIEYEGHHAVTVDLYEPDHGGIIDMGGRVIFEQPISDAALELGARIALERWGGRLQLTGGWADPQPSADADRYYIICQRLGVEITNYLPSADAKTKAIDERTAKSEIAKDAVVAEEIKSALSGGAAREEIRAVVVGNTPEQNAEIAKRQGADELIGARKSLALGERRMKNPKMAAVIRAGTDAAPAGGA